VTSVVDAEDVSSDGVFAMSLSEDGLVEMLAMYEAG
jgi:hypothetical protein